MVMPAALRRWVDTWVYQLRGPQHGALVLEHRRVYILPVSHGYLYALVLLIMLAGSINYQLSLGFVLTFLLAGLGINGILYTFRNLANLRVSAGRTRSVFVGQNAEFPLRMRRSSRDQSSHRLVVLGNDDLVTWLQLVDQLRKIGFRFFNGHG
jgi:hypothetical protein